jgi:uncharacterized protein (DUF4415 family)
MKSKATSKAYPASVADWQAILDAAPASANPPSAAEIASIEARSVVVHSGGPAAVRAALDESERAAKAALDESERAAKAALAARLPGQRGAQKTPTKKLVSLRLSPEVLRYFKDTGAGWQSRIDDALRKVAGV